MTSQTAQDNVVIRVKTERDVPPSYCAGNHGIVNHTLDSPQLNGRVANADGFHHARQQMILKEETVQGNGSAFSQIEGTSRIVKQEAVEAETCSDIYNRNKKAPVRSRSKSEGQIKPPQDNSLHDLRERTSPEKVKREYLNHVFRPGSVSRPENTFRAESASRPVPTRPEDIITSQPSLRGSESRLFQPEERIRNLHFEALKTPRGSALYASDLSYPAKQVFNQFQLAPTMASNLAQNSSVVSQRGFTARRNDDLLPRHEQQQPFQRETNHAASSVYGNNGVPQQFMPKGDGSKATSGRFQEESRINGSPPARPAQSPVSPQQNGSIPPEKNETNSTIHKKDEEPVWKTYQWYRDRKRPHSLQTKRQKAEQTIFMQYNEIRCKRVKEGRVVDVRRRASEPWFFPYSKETDQLPAKRARSPQEDTSQMSTIEHLASQPPQTLRCFSANQDSSSIPPMEIRHLDSNVRARNSKRRNSEESHFNSKGNFHCACGREHGNISQEKTAKHVIFCHEK
ncbi:hypothetical protein OS493_016977 [Desmophyllum pertusum]|uniref:Uncharacterized protein n=1 Tax=Desmophyllum pertusum TaxID=174260 RepID=A0A9W9YQ48_9CNID|nr:hypothetical protein OS493_016977 [Desmophyllum pertusum]